MNETDIQNRIKEYAKRHKCIVKRNAMLPGAEVGWPDLEIFAPNGKVLFLEIKRPGEEPRKIQNYWLTRFREFGHRATWVDNFEQGKWEIDRVLDEDL